MGAVGGLDEGGVSGRRETQCFRGLIGYDFDVLATKEPCVTLLER